MLVKKLSDVVKLYSRAALEDSKKWGMLNLVNQLFKIYFKVRVLNVNVSVSLQLCTLFMISACCVLLAIIELFVTIKLIFRFFTVIAMKFGWITRKAPSL